MIVSNYIVVVVAIEKYHFSFIGSIFLLSLIVDSFWHFDNNFVQGFRHANLNKIYSKCIFVKTYKNVCGKISVSDCNFVSAYSKGVVFLLSNIKVQITLTKKHLINFYQCYFCQLSFNIYHQSCTFQKKSSYMDVTESEDE